MLRAKPCLNNAEEVKKKYISRRFQNPVKRETWVKIQLSEDLYKGKFYSIDSRERVTNSIIN